MELKYLSGKHVTMRQIGSNCTFMELKYRFGAVLSQETLSSNCTFMELKYWSQTNAYKGAPTF